MNKLADCALCPRGCQVDRSGGKVAVCQCGRHARVSSYFPHFGEEDCLRGTRGSGTIFFSGCNLRCIFCQNFDISWQVEGEVTPPERLAEMMLKLQARGCHNINFVTPEHVVPQILEALLIAVKDGLQLPLVYNTGAYDSLESLRLMDGVIDIYMPDFKFWDLEMARRYLKVADYPETARQVIKEMHRQVGSLVFDKAAGYSHTVTGIHLKLKRMRFWFKHDGSFYSAYSLAQALGIDPHAVTRWIKSGHLKAKFRDAARGPQQKGDSYLIQEKDVRRFILQHPTDIDLRKVDQLWFLDVITNGLVRAA